MSDLLPARFVARPNRFIVEAEIECAPTAAREAAHDSGRRVQAHLADPGRLRELLLPGAELRLRPARPGSQRRTAHSVELVRARAAPRPWVSVVTTRANALARDLLERGMVDGVGAGWSVRAEVREGRSRFDFLLTRAGRRRWVEVKSVTLVENGVGLFPDAPTARGARHVEELAACVRRGDGALVLFVVQRADARRVQAHAALDPRFAAALAAAGAAGVAIRAVKFGFSGTARARFLGSVPVES